MNVIDDVYWQRLPGLFKHESARLLMEAAAEQMNRDRTSGMYLVLSEYPQRAASALVQASTDYWEAHRFTTSLPRQVLVMAPGRVVDMTRISHKSLGLDGQYTSYIELDNSEDNPIWKNWHQHTSLRYAMIFISDRYINSSSLHAAWNNLERGGVLMCYALSRDGQMSITGVEKEIQQSGIPGKQVGWYLWQSEPFGGYPAPEPTRPPQADEQLSYVLQAMVPYMDLPSQDIQLVSIKPGAFAAVAMLLRELFPNMFKVQDGQVHSETAHVRAADLKYYIQPGHVLAAEVEFMRAAQACFRLEQVGATVRMLTSGLIAMAAAQSTGEADDGQAASNADAGAGIEQAAEGAEATQAGQEEGQDLL